MKTLLYTTILLFISFTVSSQNLIVEGKIGIDTDNPSQAIDMGGRLRNIMFDYTHLGETGNGAATILANKARASETINNRVDYSDSNPDGVSAIELFYLNGISFFTRPINVGNPTVGGEQFFSPTDRTYERMRITGDGNVGIGTITPSAPLHIKGNNEALRIEGSSPVLSFYNGATQNGYLQYDASNMWFVNEQNGNIYFRTNDITRMTIDPSGKVGIGTTSPTAKLEVFGGIRNAVSGISNLGRGVYGKSENHHGVVGRTFGASSFDFYAENPSPAQNYGSASSKRWKKNITNIPDAITKLTQLRGVYFDWDEDHGGIHSLGFIAEEVGKVLPEIVVYEENGIDAKGMDYSKMTPLLVEAANAMRKEYQDMFEEQQSEINTLKQEMAELKTLLMKSVVQNANDNKSYFPNGIK